MKFGLKEKTIEQIKSVFANYPQVEEAILYGSRAMGNFKNGSDIDLTLKGGELNHSVISKISLDLDELLLPYSFDISIFKQIGNPDLVDHIKRVGVGFYEKECANSGILEEKATKHTQLAFECNMV
ncbi:nucleotidyltransferase domain-containing protein [bacterium]|nr:nucleotidyltransferase domain-containing protein [bacterium]MBU1754159.1 nucleotidyltransferase domain-containing protein [bacterium]